MKLAQSEIYNTCNRFMKSYCEAYCLMIQLNNKSYTLEDIVADSLSLGNWGGTVACQNFLK